MIHSETGHHKLLKSFIICKIVLFCEHTFAIISAALQSYKTNLVEFNFTNCDSGIDFIAFQSYKRLPQLLV